MRCLPAILCLLLVCVGCRRSGQPEYQGKSLRYWEAQAAGKNADDRRAAAKALGEIGPPGLRALTKLFRDRDHHVRAAALLAVTGMRQAAVPQLRELLRDPDADVRAGATKAFLQAVVDRGPKEAVPQLTKLLRDPSANVRARAAQALLRTGPAAKAAVPALTEALGDESPAVRRAAATTLRILKMEKGPAKVP